MLRSVEQNLLTVKKTRIKIGDSSFTVATSVFWNALPSHINKTRTIDCFKSMIKTSIKIVDSSFTVATSVFWNALTSHINKTRTIDCFKSMIKTNLFRL